MNNDRPLRRVFWALGLAAVSRADKGVEDGFAESRMKVSVIGWRTAA